MKTDHLKLIKPETKPLTLLQDEELKKEICIAITTGQCTIPEDIVKLFNIKHDQVINLLSDTSFLYQINKYTQAKLQLTFHTQIPNRLEKIINSDDNKESLQAMKLAAQLSNNLKSTVIDITNNNNINLESLVRESEKQVHIDVEHRKVS